MNSIIGLILAGIRAASATMRRRILLAVVVSMVVAVPTYAAIISNQTQHNVTIQDVTITTSPSISSIQPSGSTETGTVTVSTPQTFSGRLTLSITNSTLGATTINPASFTVTINSFPVIGIPGGKSIGYIGGTMTILDGTQINYTVSFLSKVEDPVNGIQSGTVYTISQVVSQ